MKGEMKILLICAGGLSTGFLTERLQQKALENGVELIIEAHGVNCVKRYYHGFDIILLGPQVRFRLQEIRSLTGLPAGVIAPEDFAMQNCEAIFQLAQELCAQKE